MGITINPYVGAFIFARGGSQGVPRKNIRRLGGKPLIAYAIESGLACRAINHLAVSTDDAEIAAVARRYGADVPFMRPEALARNDSPELLAWKHAIQEFRDRPDLTPIDIFVSLPTTAPFRAVEDIDACLTMFLQHDPDIVITVKRASRHPAFNMVTLDRSGNARLAMEAENRINRRQDAPAMFDMTTVAYVAKPEFILRAESIFDGNVMAVIVPDQRALDIDTMLDFEFAEFLAERARRS